MSSGAIKLSRMTAAAPIDTTLDFRADSRGRDSDRHSPTLQGYHQRLWSRVLPDGAMFDLEPVRRRGSYLLRHPAPGGDLFLSSDILANSSKRPCHDLYQQVPEDVRARFHSVGLSIGGRLIFPAERVDGMQTVNQRRGTHPRVRDRFDLTLECIRRHFVGEPSPLAPVLQAHASFFQRFVDFRGYVSFFLLDDLLDERSAVRFYLPFSDFEGRVLAKSLAEYRQFLDRQVEFVEARNARISSLPA
jgi:hypothetical protein